MDELHTTIALPGVIRIGTGASAALVETLETLGVKSPFLVTDPFLARSGFLERITGPLTAAGISFKVFADTEAEPTDSCVEAARAAMAGEVFDGVVALGGGSVIDTAKMLAVLWRHGGPIRALAVPHVENKPGLPIVAIPTTAGAGSEATRFCVITDSAFGEKLLCSGLAYMPSAALVDFELSLSMPPRLTADTGLDALTHAIEAYVSNKSNPISDALALSAMSLIGANLVQAFRRPDDRQARAAMMLGATQAGMAFSNSSVALVHGMSRPIGAHFHVPHGLSNAMLLPAITAFSAPSAPARYAACARALGCSDGLDDAGSVSRLLERLRILNAELLVPTPYDYGIALNTWLEKTPLMAQQALASGSPGNNPRNASAEEIQALYLEIYQT